MTGAYFDKIDTSASQMQPDAEFRESRLSDIEPSALWLVEIPSRHGFPQDLKDRDQTAWAKGMASQAI